MDPFVEQRALARGEAVAPLPERGVLTVTGPDRLSWLDSVTSQSIARLAPGESAETLLLDPTGRIEHAIRILDDGETAWLLLDAGEAEPLAAWLERMRFMLRVEIADRGADFLVYGYLDRSAAGGEPPARPHAIANGVPLVWSDPWQSVQQGGWQYAGEGHPGGGWSWREALLERSRLAELDGVPSVDPSAAEALRIAAWRPTFSREVDERSIPNELDWLRSAVHLSKGCYRGQETVAKVHNLGHPPRRIAFLHIDGSDNIPAAHGDDVVRAGTDEVIGRVTSAANHYELGPIALAVLKRSVDPAAPLEVRHEGARLAAAQEVIVPPDAGSTVDVPRLPRLGAVRR